ncbi:AsmA-like C-terminal region-containing protein [Campylobacter sp. JMF_04 NA10]|uniref:hypothetical protein n=1 Tax=Campylobacter sp. JMF_04 NA10 TaxID=2983824 RepID=UPI0022EA0030|nr:hypothetical protein [Campylobacter sp. JMF_04 NA10]MDA3076587.1 AsmA-like C-terminal region-containing protein [Campylobacter sp. JMF_04 NA10]
MKYIIGILVFIGVIFGGVFALLWSDFGNSITKPYIERYLSQKTGFDIKLDKFDLNCDDFDITALINGEISAHLVGKYDIFSKSFDTNYELNAKDLKSFGVALDGEAISLNGRVLGNMQKISANGAGRAFDSDVKFLANLTDFMPTDLQIVAPNLNVAKILAVAGQPLYATGNVAINSNIIAKNGAPEGSATIKSQNLLLNEKALKDLNITIPSGVKIALNSDISVSEGIAKATSEISSNLANLSAKQSVFDMQKRTLQSDFTLSVPELKNLAKIINYETSGDLLASGELISDFKDFTLKNTNINAFKNGLKAVINGAYNAPSKDGKASANFAISDFAKLSHITGQKFSGSGKGVADITLKSGKLANLALNLDALGGNLIASGNLSALSVRVKSLNLAVITSFLGLEAIGNGAINGEAKLNLASGINGELSANIANGVLYKKYLDKLSGKSFPSDTKFSLNFGANIKNSLANFTAKLGSDLANFDKITGTYNLKTSTLNADYGVNVPNLSKMKFLTGIELFGKFNANGKIDYKPKNFAVSFASNILGGAMNGKMINDDVSVKLTKFAVKELTDMLGVRHIYDGVGDMDFSYNTNAKKGKFNSLINQGRLKSSDFMGVVSKILGRDLAGEVYNNVTLDGTIVQNLITFNTNMSAQKSKLNVSGGKFDTQSKQINIPVKANIEKTDISVQITGTTQNPKYSVDSAYLKEKLNKEISKGIDKLLGDKGSKSGQNTGANSDAQNNAKEKSREDKAKEAVKGILKGLF